MSRVLVITTEPLPLAGWPTTGAGLRAWGLAEALRARGHEVTLLMPEDALAGFTPPKGSRAPTVQLPPEVATFGRDRLGLEPRLSECDVILLQHWGLARDLGEVSVPLALDLAGPHLLERRLWGSAAPEADLGEKLDALRRADFVVASGRRQRLYFLPYLAMAGWDVASAQPCIPVIPFSLGTAADPAPVRADRFIFGGFFLPWQDPSRALEIAIEEMDAAGRGELVFIGGPHPRLDVSLGRFDELVKRMADHPRVKHFGPMSYDDYLELLAEGGVALDLMARNAERELAFTTRTVRYMASGLPVIHDDYSELGAMIARTGAGWTLDPDDESGLRGLMRGLLEGRIDPSQRALGALGLVHEELDPDKTIEPLDEFCRSPRDRREKVGSRLKFEQRDRAIDRLQGELERTQGRLNSLLGKRWVRWGLRWFSPAGVASVLLAPLAALAGLGLFVVFWVTDRWGKS